MNHSSLASPLAAEMYVREVERGSCDGTATPTLIKETPATAYVDGRNAIGPVSTCHSHNPRTSFHTESRFYSESRGRVLSSLSPQTVAIYCMDLAIRKAKEVGIGWVTCVGQYCNI